MEVRDHCDVARDRCGDPSDVLHGGVLVTDRLGLAGRHIDVAINALVRRVRNRRDLRRRDVPAFEGGFDKDTVNLAWKRVTDFFVEHLKTL